MIRGGMGQAGGLVLTCLLLIGGVAADLYLQIPRGSNNRLNERTATRTNANRMFDSQNNNRGGYNVGDKTDIAAGTDQEKQYRMKYFQSGPYRTTMGWGKSFLNIEWTNQHGCGGNENDSPQKQNCAVVLQYMCQTDVDSAKGTADSFRNGQTTATPQYAQPNKNNINKDRKKTDVKLDRGLHENWDWYNRCYLRERNGGLFVADQKLAETKNLGYSSAINTRQNPTGNRYGYECPEERDYYPYWHPTPWVDAAVLTDSQEMCRLYKGRSFNVRPYYECIHKDGWSRYNTKTECTNSGGRWLQLTNYLEKATNIKSESECNKARIGGLRYKWAVAHDSTNGYNPECLVKLDPPSCEDAPWSRSNHLGNGRDGVTLNYKWTLPYFPSGEQKRCVFRMRYNITTDDYDPRNTDYKQNDEFPAKSPVRQNPYVYVMKQVSPLRLAINTAQYGRVFQDRSHVFLLKPRGPANIDPKGSLYNLNVRGKRGNIVQTFPATEYDFAPTELRIRRNQFVHFQWTGSNSHKNGGDGGDGQTGDAGQGTSGTDRHNVVEMLDRSGNFPVRYVNTTMWDSVEIVWIYHGKKNLDNRDLAINMATSGYYQCASEKDCQGEAADKKAAVQTQLNNAPASYEGAVLKFTKRGTYHILCTRNNSFSNRSQKAAIIVE